MDTYICEICGYIYDPAVGEEGADIKPGTSFDDLPDDYFCPDCYAPKDDFVKT